MSKIIELRQKRAYIWDKAKAFLDERRGDDGLISAEDNEAYERMETDVVNLGKEIERLERVETMDRELSHPTTQPLTGKPEASRIGEEKSGTASAAYAQAFWQHMRNRTSYEVRNALQVGSDSEGGFSVPDEFEHTLLQGLEEEDIMRSLAHIIRTSSGDRKIPIVASKGAAQWSEEEAAFTESDDSFGQITIGAHKVTSLIKISEELLNDSAFDMAAYIAHEFGRRVGAAEEGAFIAGDGNHKPTGLLHNTLGAELGVTAAGAAAITADELIDLVYSLKAGYRRRAVFIMNDATVKMIRKLKDNNGTFLWTPGLLAGQPDTLLNQKILTSSYMPLPTSGNKAILYGDMSNYWIADREGRNFQRLNELYAANGQIGFRITQRVDGRLVLQESVKCLKMKV